MKSKCRESQGGTDTEQIAVLVTTVTKDDDVAQGAVLKLALTLTLKEDALVMTLAVQNAGTSGYEFTLELQSAVAVTALSTCGLRGEYIERRVAGQESEVGRRRVGGAAAALHKPFDRIFEGCVGKPSSLFLGFFIVFYSLCKGVWCATSSSSTCSQPLVLHSQKETFANDHVRVILCHSATIGLLLQFRMPCNADREDVIRCVVTFSFCSHFPYTKVHTWSQMWDHHVIEQQPTTLQSPRTWTSPSPKQTSRTCGPPSMLAQKTRHWSALPQSFQHVALGVQLLAVRLGLEAKQ